MGISVIYLYPGKARRAGLWIRIRTSTKKVGSGSGMNIQNLSKKKNFSQYLLTKVIKNVNILIILSFVLKKKTVKGESY